MAESQVPAGSRIWESLDRLRIGAAIIAAVVGALTAVWGIYEKLKADTREVTAASYETLAPQLNQMSDALQQLQKDNQRMREALIQQSGRRAVAGRTAPARPRPGAAPPPEVPATPDAGAPAAAEKDPLREVLGTVGRARETVEKIRKVPEEFEKVLKDRGK